MVILPIRTLGIAMTVVLGFMFYRIAFKFRLMPADDPKIRRCRIISCVG